VPPRRVCGSPGSASATRGGGGECGGGNFPCRGALRCRCLRAARAFLLAPCPRFAARCLLYLSGADARLAARTEPGGAGDALPVTRSFAVLGQVLSTADAFNLAPASLRSSSFRASKDAAVNTKPALAVAPKARAGRVPVSVRPALQPHMSSWTALCWPQESVQRSNTSLLCADGADMSAGEQRRPPS